MSTLRLLLFNVILLLITDHGKAIIPGFDKLRNVKEKDRQHNLQTIIQAKDLLFKNPNIIYTEQVLDDLANDNNTVVSAKCSTQLQQVIQDIKGLKLDAFRCKY